MRKLLLAFALILVGAVPAFAYDTPKALLEALYTPYSQGDFLRLEQLGRSAVPFQTPQRAVRP